MLHAARIVRNLEGASSIDKFGMKFPRRPKLILNPLKTNC